MIPNPSAMTQASRGFAMSRIRVRALETADMSQVNRLHRTRDDMLETGAAEQRTELLEWLAFHNPFAQGDCTYYVAEDAGAIVAFQGRMPVEFIINGTRTKGYHVHDTYVHPDYRKKGWGFSLITSLFEAIEQQSDSFFCVLGATPLNLKIQQRMGYCELAPVPQYTKMLNPHRQLSRFLRLPLLVTLLNPLALVLLFFLDALVMRVNATSLHTIPIERFDSRFDELMNKISGKLGICSYKGSAYLNWKYVDRPFKRDTVFAVEKEGQITGFIVLAPSMRRSDEGGVIMDLVADPDDTQTIAALCQTMIEYFKSKGAHFIRCAMSDGRFVDVLKRFLFVKSGGEKALLLGNMDRVNLDDKDIMDTNKWHVTLGEADGFMLTP